MPGRTPLQPGAETLRAFQAGWTGPQGRVGTLPSLKAATATKGPSIVDTTAWRNRVMVLGATGLVGRYIHASMTGAGWDVVAVSRSASGPGAVALDLSRCTPADLRTLLLRERPAAIVNAAGSVWGTSDGDLIASTVGATRHLVAALSGLPVSVRLVQLGSVHEYRPPTDHRPIDEDAPVGPVSAYGKAKLRASLLVTGATAAGLVDGVVLRVSNVLGSGMPTASLLGAVADRLGSAVPGQPVELRLGALRGYRDFIDARDVARAVVTTVAMSDPPRLVNLGCGTALSVRSVVDQLIAVSGRAAVILESGAGTAMGGPVDWQQVDIRRAADTLEWVPRIDLIDSLRSVLVAPGTRPPLSGTTAV
jgi:nucleoside-diphosphate-sugar epimerase